MTLDDDLILWQIALLRHDAHLRKELIKRLSVAQREALALLTQGNLKNVRQERDIVAKMQAVIREGYGNAGIWLNGALNDMMPVVAAINATIYAKHLGQGFSAPDNLSMPDVYGANVKDWLNQQANKHAFVIRRQVRQVRTGERILSEVGDDVRQYLKRGNIQSEALVRTAAAVASGEANIAVIRKSKRVKYLIQKSHLDSRTTSVCRARHNKRWDAKTLEPIGHELEYKQPPLHWNCRSIIKPLLSDKLRDEDSYSFEDWLDNMPANIQDKALGKGKAAIWRKMKAKGQALTINDLLDQKGRELSLSDLKQRYTDAANDAL